MHELTEVQVAELRWGDANFFGYFWDSQFANPTLVIRVAPANAPTQELVCNWATNLKLDIDYKSSVNTLLTWDVAFKGSSRAGWEV